MRFAGIDIGATGAMALYEVGRGDLLSAAGRRVADISDLPIEEDGRLDVEHLKRWMLAHHPDQVWIEEVRIRMVRDKKTGKPMPWGATAMTGFMRLTGMIEGVVRCMGYDLRRVEPGVWKRRADLLGQDKEAARLLAIELMPGAKRWLTRKKDHNRAEALLLARYGAEKILIKRNATGEK